MRKYILILALASLALSACDNKPKPKQEPMMMVSLPPPPPPPPKPKPTPPPVEQPQEQKVQEKQSIDPDPKPQAAPKPEAPKPDEPPAGLGSNIKGDPDGFGLSGSGDFGVVGGTGRGNGGGNPAGYYAGQVQGWIAEALRQDKRTRSANLATKVKLWIDDTGKITRVEPGSGANVANLESVLIGMRLPARPPQGRTMTVTYNIAARRP